MEPDDNLCSHEVCLPLRCDVQYSMMCTGGCKGRMFRRARPALTRRWMTCTACCNMASQTKCPALVRRYLAGEYRASPKSIPSAQELTPCVRARWWCVSHRRSHDMPSTPVVTTSHTSPLSLHFSCLSSCPLHPKNSPV